MSLTDAQYDRLVTKTEALRALVQSPGWQFVVEHLQDASSGLVQELTQPASSMDGVMKKEFIAGKMNALTTFPQALIAEIKANELAIKAYRERQEENEEDPNDV